MLRFFKGPTPLCWAHRGASSLAPENTLAAGELAAQAGARAWEVDVCLSADKVPVLLHDDTLERTTDVALRFGFASRKPWRVHAFTLAELRSLDAGSWFTRQDPFGQVAAGTALAPEECAAQRIPTLQEALQLSLEHGLALNIELKEPLAEQGAQAGRDLVLAVAAVVESLRAEELCLFSSFAPELLRLAREHAPDVPRALLLAKRRGGVSEMLRALREVEAVALHPGRKLLALREIEQLRGEDVLVNVWTVDDADAMRELAKAGAGVFTNFPQRCP